MMGQGLNPIFCGLLAVWPHASYCPNSLSFGYTICKASHVYLVEVVGSPGICPC